MFTIVNTLLFTFNLCFAKIIIGENMKDSLKKLDKTLLIVTIILSIFGLVMIFSSSSISAVLQYKVTEYYFFYRQGIVVVLGFFIILFLINIKTERYNYLSVLGIVGIILILIAMKTYGTVTNSAKSWLDIGPISIQPSEFAKTTIILFLACWYGSRTKKKQAFKSFYDIFIPLIPCIIIFGLVALEPDLGTACIIASICMFIFFTLPFEKKISLTILKVSTVLIGVGVIVFLNSNSELLETLLTSNQESRLNFRHPCSRYLEETGYQVCNGYIAINNGGLMGVGLGKSTQKYLYLPESHTDFIFPIIVEELGLLGGGAVFILYIILLYRILLIARNAKSLRGSIIAFGTFGYIFTHIIVNIGGLLALIPLTGVPLPFLSYGGSFTLNLLILIGLTERVAIENKKRKAVK